MNTNLLKSLLFILSLLFIFFFTMLPFPSLDIGVGQKGYNLIPFKTIKEVSAHDSLFKMIINNGGNIALFIPLGFTLPLRFTKIKNIFMVVLLGALLSTIIECTQLVIPSRWSDIDDVILNTLGTIVGYCMLILTSKCINNYSKRNNIHLEKVLIKK